MGTRDEKPSCCFTTTASICIGSRAGPLLHASASEAVGIPFSKNELIRVARPNTFVRDTIPKANIAASERSYTRADKEVKLAGTLKLTKLNLGYRRRKRNSGTARSSRSHSGVHGTIRQTRR